MPKEIRRIEEKESESRLDRWFKREYPFLSHGQVEKMLRTKKIKVNGAKAKADYRVQTGDEVAIFFSAAGGEGVGNKGIRKIAETTGKGTDAAENVACREIGVSEGGLNIGCYAETAGLRPGKKYGSADKTEKESAATGSTGREGKKCAMRAGEKNKTSAEDKSGQKWTTAEVKNKTKVFTQEEKENFSGKVADMPEEGYFSRMYGKNASFRAVSHIVLTEKEVEYIRSLVIYKDEWLIALNKPAGLAVQGGSKVGQHVDRLLDGLKFEKEERPFIVHRLDKETSGVLLLARDRKTAAKLAQMFQTKQMRKIYWAVLDGVPAVEKGKINAPLLKKSGRDGYESVVVDENGQKAVTYYCTLDKAGNKVSWLALMPKTGRTHQLRVHCASMGTPILGDVKYGAERFSGKGEASPLFSEKMHLHARSLSLPHPMKPGKLLSVKAPLPPHMRTCFDFFGFDEKEGERFFESFLKQTGEV